MLDDLKYIHEKDVQDALGIAEKQWQQLEYDFDLPDLDNNAKNIVFAGMGGSALAALLATTWPGLKIPFEISRDYKIPEYTSSDTLFIASSYSGNTEETLESLSLAEAKEANIVVITSGGKLAEIAKVKKYPLAILPHISQPRYAVLYSFKALLSILEKSGFNSATNDKTELSGAIKTLKDATAKWRPDIAAKDNYAKKLAYDIVGKSVVIYGGPLTYPAAYKWKISFNENAKNVAWVNQYPEFNHNEFIGWVSHPLDKPYAVIDLKSNFEHPQIQKRFDVSAKLLSGRRPSAITVNAVGQTLLDQLLWLVALGDFVTIYVALLNGLNPTPIDLIDKLKKELA